MKEELKESESSSFEKAKHSFKKKVGAAVLAVLITANMTGCIASSKVEAAGNTQTTTEQTEPSDNDNETTTANSTETETEAEKSTEELISEAEIPAGLSDEETAKLIIDRFSDWNMAGATDELYEKTTSNGGADYDKYLNDESEKWADIYATALFGDNYKDNQDIASIVNRFKEVNEDCLSHYLASKAGSSHGLYDTSRTFENVESVDNSDGTTTYVIDYIQSDNGAETTNLDTDLYAEQTGTFKTVEKDGKLVIEEISVTDIQSE